MRLASDGAALTSGGVPRIESTDGMGWVWSAVSTVAHTQSALHFYADADVICDVGGQDIKIIILKDGRVKDFKLNTQCSAGNGYFLQGMAEQFGIPVEEYAAAAFSARRAKSWSAARSTSSPSRADLRAVVQRVSEASVTVDGRVTGAIGRGFLVLVCAMAGDMSPAPRSAAALSYTRSTSASAPAGTRRSGGPSSFRRTESSSATTSCCSTRSPFPTSCAAPCIRTPSSWAMPATHTRPKRAKA